jgi:hypothetical protein
VVEEEAEVSEVMMAVSVGEEAEVRDLSRQPWDV